MTIMFIDIKLIIIKNLEIINEFIKIEIKIQLVLIKIL
jgi:hypothetical protein